MARRGENIRKRTDGRWEARYPVLQENGVKVYRSVYGTGYLAAKRKREQILKQQPMVPRNLSEMTLKDLSELWLTHVKTTIKESSYTRYVRNIQIYILPYFQNTALKNISVQHLSNTFLIEKVLKNQDCL